MENTNEKIANLQLQISEKSTDREKSIIELYWKFNGLIFFDSAKNIGEVFEITPTQLNKLIASYSLLSFSIPCSFCNKFDNFQVRNRSDFKSTINQALSNSAASTYKCSFCKRKAQNEVYLKNIQEQKKITHNLEKAIEIKSWKNLSNFQKGMLCNCFKMKFRELQKHYLSLLGQDQWCLFYETLEKIEEQNLLILQRDSNSKNITNFHYLDQLPNFKDEISIKEAINKSSFERDAETNELKFKLTTNKDIHYPDSPLHSGTITFKERIIIEPGTEYIFGLWKRANDNLYLTMVPIENLEKLPIQKKISDKPIQLQKKIVDFLNKTGKENNV